ncbi:hypothetical protein U9M48_013543 [Paspalum notatum var. saurae]|uniref:Uncharacterized protein n=1 Tax=Paspalum notatum var. saurae TaxID=547442 RepID=A0AAQ3T2G2_PASNO
MRLSAHPMLSVLHG